MNKFVKIFLMVALCLGLGYFSGQVTQASVNTWYPTLIKPSFNPPNWAFPVAWTTLFIIMGISAGLVWAQIQSKPEEVKKALLFFGIQLILNVLWSILFFGLRNPMLALIEIVLLWFLIYETFIKFNRVSATAGYLLVPYLIWVGFAIILNASIVYLNP